MSIFKAYDIRGKYPDEINEEIAYKIGRAFVTFTKTTDVMVGKDCRTHSPNITAALIKGLLEQGANVTDIGLATTPQVIAMHIWKEHETAIMVTASHLDAPFNGFKLYTQAGQNINANYGMKEIEQLVNKNNFSKTNHGTLTHANYTEEYAKHIFTICPTKTNLKFIVDCSNGSVYPELQYYQKNLNLILINEKPDGTFPGHSPNPIHADAQNQIKEVILQEKAKGGCIFDADGDRVVFFDEHGAMIHPNYTSCIIIDKLLKEYPDRTIAYDLISSRIVPETITSLGGKPLRTKVGRNILVDDMRKHKALFAGESSSHMIYESANYADATTLSLLIILDVLANSKQQFSELVKPYAKYCLLLETNYEVANPDDVIKDLEATFPEAKRDYLDGIFFSFPNGWINLRKSNTEPLLRMRAEADTQEQLQKLVKQAEKVIQSHGGYLSKH